MSRTQTVTPRKRPVKGRPHLGTQKPHLPGQRLQHLNFETIQSVIHHTIPSCCTSRERNLADNNHITRRTGMVHTDISPIYKTRQWSNSKIACGDTIKGLHPIADAQGGCIKSSFMLIFPLQSGELIQRKFWVGPSDLQ